MQVTLSMDTPTGEVVYSLADSECCILECNPIRYQKFALEDFLRRSKNS